MRITGDIFGHPGYADGHTILTSIAGAHRIQLGRLLVKTVSGTIYHLDSGSARERDEIERVKELPEFRDRN